MRSLTLIEVIASLVILGGTLTTFVVVQASAVHRIGVAGRQLTAARLARELVTEWRLRDEDFTQERHGGFDGREPGWVWHRFSEAFEVRDGMVLTLVTLDLTLVSSSEGSRPWVRRYTWLEDRD